MVAMVKSVEDHGYVLDIGLQTIAGFLRRQPKEVPRMIGEFVNVTVESMAEDDRTCMFTDDQAVFSKAQVWHL
jgi:rRNA biogenesis protein RRP5